MATDFYKPLPPNEYKREEPTARLRWLHKLVMEIDPRFINPTEVPTAVKVLQQMWKIHSNLTSTYLVEWRDVPTENQP